MDKWYSFQWVKLIILFAFSLFSCSGLRPRNANYIDKHEMNRSVEFVEFKVSKGACDWVSNKVNIKTASDSGRISFEVFDQINNEWTTKSSSEGRFSSKSYDAVSKFYNIKYAVSWLLEDTQQLIRACFDDLKGFKQCEEPLTVKGCQLFSPMPKVELTSDSLYIHFDEIWENQTVYLNLESSSRVQIPSDTIYQLKKSYYSKQVTVLAGESYRLSVLWNFQIFIRDINLNTARN